MKVLFISEYFGTTAPGIVAEKIALGLSEHAEVDIITSDYCPRFSGKCQLLKSVPMFRSYRLEQLSWRLLKTNIFAKLWVLIVGKQRSSNYDLIFSVVSMGHFCALEVGERVKRKVQCPYFSYFVDAIPAPEEYVTGQNHSLSAQMFDYAVAHSSNVNVIFSTCKEMSDYQKNRFEGHLSHKVVFDELLNPSDFSELHFLENKVIPGRFVYAGGLYGLRTPKYMLSAFERIVMEYPFAKLVFVGTKLDDDTYQKLSASLKEHIEILPYTDKLETIYASAECLIDVATDVKKDVYMSSKLTSYCAYNRPIICESSTNSPARRVFADLNTVFHCEHKSEEIYKAMKTVIETDQFDYSERKEILQSMTIESSTKSILYYYAKCIES